MTVKKKCGMVLKSVVVCDECKRNPVEFTAIYVYNKQPAELCTRCAERLTRFGSIIDRKEIKNEPKK
jgi:hypothetical protein